jgi:xanthine dehydrogenase accessory factor
MNDRDWSVSEADVLSSLRDIRRSDRRGVLATVVDVEGRSYRRPGAKMVVDAEGGGRGHITAGCLEDEVVELAESVLERGEPRVETYDLTDDEDDVWGLGIGCNGIIDVLIEPVGPKHDPLVAAFEADDPVAGVTVLEGDAPTGARASYREGGVTPESERFPDWLASAVEGPAATLVEEDGSDTVTVETEQRSATVFVDGIRPAPWMIIFGSGHDVGPVAELAKKNGFRVAVVGFRGAIDLVDRFPAADAHVSTSPGRLAADLDVDLGGEVYAVVMTHNFVDDRLTVETLLDAGVPYVGLLGPRERFEEMLDAFEADGRTVSPEDLDSLYTPVGLDLGAGSPYAIATSVVAEVLTVSHDRRPRHLSEREGPIHDRVSVDPGRD